MGKLMKHEIRANSRIMLPMFLLAALLSVLGGLSARFLDSGQDSVFLRVVLTLFLLVFGLALVLLAFLSFIYMVQRFYATMAGKEAYLTMNLPRSIDEHIASKLLTAMIWSVLTALVTLAMIAIFFLVSGGTKPFEMLSDAYIGFKAQISVLGIKQSDITLLVIEGIIMFIVQIAASYLMIYTAIAIGQQSSEKKLGSSIAAFAGIAVITGIVGSLLTSALAGYFGDYSQDFIYFNAGIDFIKFIRPIFLSSLGFGILQCLVYYFVSSRILKTKLNLS